MLTDDGRPMPPVSSQQAPGTAAGSAGRIAPPFTGQPASAAQPMAAIAPSEPEELADLSHVAPRGEAEFPMDAFIIPEHTQRLPTGIEEQPVHAEPTHTPLTDLADRLEKLSHRLRIEGSDAVIARLESGDPIDARIAALLSGILASSQ